MDAAFPAAAFPGHTLAELEAFLADPADRPADRLAMLRAEVDRRRAVAAGDRSQMTPGERLRAVRQADELERAKLRAAAPLRPVARPHGLDGLGLFDHASQGELF